MIDNASTLDAAREESRPLQGTNTLLVCGVLGAALFILLNTIQVLTREDFDAGLHALSLLGLDSVGQVRAYRNGTLTWVWIASLAGRLLALHTG